MKLCNCFNYEASLSFYIHEIAHTQQDFISKTINRCSLEINWTLYLRMHNELKLRWICFIYIFWCINLSASIMVLRLKWTHSFPADLQSSQQGGVLISAKSDTKKKTPTQSHLFVPYLFLKEDLQPHHTGWALNLMFCVSLAVQTPTGESLLIWTVTIKLLSKLPAELLADQSFETGKA